MKKTLILFALFLIAGLSSPAQNIINPQIGHRDDMNTAITKIETDKENTIVSFEYSAQNKSSWIQLNKEIYIQTRLNNKHYNYVRSENITMVPDKHTFANDGDKLLFKVYFEKIPTEANSIDIIERAGTHDDGIGYLNFYNVSLTQQQSLKTKVVDMNITHSADIVNMDMGSHMAGLMDSMGPMFGNLTKTMMDAKINYYKQPGKLTEVAKLNKQYFNALVKEGFTSEQALKIITSESLFSKSDMAGK